jgi:tetratricopeptide (TPR) repeat protein
MVIQLSSAAYKASVRKDWAQATRLLGLAREEAAKVKEPLRLQLTAVVELQLGTILYQQGKFEEAEDLLRQGLVKGRSTLAEDAEVLRHATRTWGDLCSDSGRHGEAEQHYRRLLAADELRGNRGAMIFDLQRIADCLVCQERLSEAEGEMSRAMKIEAAIVKGNPISMCLPDVHFCRGEYEEARRLYRVKVEFWERQPARPEEIDLGRLQMRLAFSEASTGHTAEAAEMYARAEATFQRDWSAEHPKALAARQARAALNEAGVRA